MPSKSFKRDLNGRPFSYRTPSPPRDAFEYFSPADDGDHGSILGPNGTQWSINSSHGNIRRKTISRPQTERMDQHTRSGSGGAMEAFASIALATSSDIIAHPQSRNFYASHCNGSAAVDVDAQAERPAKRARSEKLPSPELRRAGASKEARPTTSYGQSSDSRMLEAELLLNFAQEARFAVPRQPKYEGYQKQVSPTVTMSQKVATTVPSEPELAIGACGRSSQLPADKIAANCKVTDLQSEATGSDIPPVAVLASEHLERVDTVLQQLPTVTQTERLEPFEPVTGAQHVYTNANAEAHDRTDTQQTVVTQTEERSGAKARSQSRSQEDFDYTRSTKAHDIGAVGNIGDGSLEAADVTLGDQATTSKADNGHPDSTGETERIILNEIEEVYSQGNELGSRKPSAAAETIVSSPGQKHHSRTEETDPEAREILSGANATKSPTPIVVPAVCAACNFSRSTVDGESDSNSTSWISCDACKSWFHFACAGFKNEREVRGVDKYRCRKCKPIHGPTTYVRKSARAHSAIDYAGLHQGVIKTSDETLEHHYIKPIKEGTISFLPETFARIRPELATAEHFEKGYGWKEPIVIPAAWNPRHQVGTSMTTMRSAETEQKSQSELQTSDPGAEEWDFTGAEREFGPDHGQDALDMVMPHGLTVRAVAELYGPEEKVEVIDVKSQNGEGKKWNMRRWADYYESKGNKIVRNVISLEVSQSKLGRLIRRPQIVRDLDLQDSVWPAELQAKGEIPRVQFYCLMSVADCFTDFHIDFGGSSVFYHILKGKKTFFFIPPKEKHLKKYEEWCLSPAQNWTFLGDQTRECYRVDLFEGDTMLIPAGWIHAVWTPEDSLVIGGNFLTRLNFGMQLRISQIEKATGVARKFRYPHFQKIHWYTAFRYMEEDPLPDIVQKLLQEGEIFYREKPAHHEFDDWGENSKCGLGNYHARYYSQAELEGLPDLTRYLLRTALIDIGSITDGITQETRNAVKRSIPRGHGEPLEVVKKFAAWCAWKRGNETIPSWAYPDAIPEPESAGKVTAAAQKKLDKEAALQAPRRQSTRMQSHHSPLDRRADIVDESTPGTDIIPLKAAIVLDMFGNDVSPLTPTKRKHSESGSIEPSETNTAASKKRRRTSGTSHRKVACESCRKRRRACKHKDSKDVLYPDTKPSATAADAAPLPIAGPQVDALIDLASSAGATSMEDYVQLEAHAMEPPANTEADNTEPQSHSPSSEDIRNTENDESNYLLKTPDEMASTPKMLTHLSGAGLLRLEHRIAGGPVNGLSVLSLNAPHSRGRTKACNDCRKSKRRCIHDEYGNEDPVKAREAAIPRPAAAKRKFDDDGNEIPSAKRLRKSSGTIPPNVIDDAQDFETPGRVSSYQTPVSNVAVAPFAMILEPSSEPKLRPPDNPEMLSAFGQIHATVEPVRHNDLPGTQTPYPQHEENAPNPPAPAARSCTTVSESQSHEFPDGILEHKQDELRNDLSPATSIKRNIPIDPALEHISSSFALPAASLVSPPASSHADASRTPPSPSAASSRHSSHHPRQIQRYTPESGPRRGSSSSIDEAPTSSNDGRADSAVSEALALGKDTSPITTISTTGEDEHKAEMNVTHTNFEADRKDEDPVRKSRGSIEGMADEESLKLIKELQAQEYGLRRRGKV